MQVRTMQVRTQHTPHSISHAIVHVMALVRVGVAHGVSFRHPVGTG
jgi:hypothetical protein